MANIAEFYDAGDYSTPANFERRLRTSLEGIDTSSLAHAKYESGRLKIRNIAIANTNKWNFNSLSTTHTHTKKILYKKKSEINDNLKR